MIKKICDFCGEEVKEFYKYNLGEDCYKKFEKEHFALRRKQEADGLKLFNKYKINSRW